MASRLFGPYRINRIYALDLPDRNLSPAPVTTMQRLTDGKMLAAAEDPDLRARAWVAQPGTFGYGRWEGGKLACVCWFWPHPRFDDALVWRIGAREAMLMEVVTARAFRGAGLAPSLIEHAAAQLQADGFRALYAFIWHSNKPSIRAFEKAGWRHVALVVEVHPFGRARPLRLQWPPACRTRARIVHA